MTAPSLLRGGAGVARRAVLTLQESAPYRVVGRHLGPFAKLRPAVARDSSRVAGMLGVDATAGPYGADASGGSRHDAIVAELAGRLVGVVEVVRLPRGDGPFEGHWLCTLFVARQARRLGIGRRLVTAAVEDARRESAAVVTLTVADDNTRALALYRSLGFEVIESGPLAGLLQEEAERTGRRRLPLELCLSDEADQRRSATQAISDAIVEVVCASGDPSDVDGSRLRAAARRVEDWGPVVDLAREQGLAAVLHARLETLAVEVGDVAARERLRRLHAASQTLATQSIADLHRVVAVLEDHGVRVMTLKGTAQSQVLYGDPGLRQSSDIDLVVPADAALVATRALEEAGFRSTLAPFDVPDDVLLRNENELGLRGPSGRPLVEIHWRVGERGAWGALAAADLFAGSCRVAVAEREVLVPGDADLLIVLCTHAGQHGWDKLEALVAIVHAARRIDAGRWAAVLDRATHLRCRRRLLVGLQVAHTAVGVEPPLGMRAPAAADPAVRRLAAGADLVWRRGSRWNGPGDFVGQTWHYVLSDDTLSAAAVHAVARATTPGVHDWVSLRLPHRLHGLYYLWRPLRLAGKLVRLRRQARVVAAGQDPAANDDRESEAR